jgi:hypothetical protein
MVGILVHVLLGHAAGDPPLWVARSRAAQPATPVAGGPLTRNLQGAAHRLAREGQLVSDVPGIATAIRPEGF